MTRPHRRRDDRSDEAALYRALYSTPFWDWLRRAKLMRNQNCERCEGLGRTTPATVVHHIKDHKGNRRLFFAYANLQSVCKPCHDGPIQQRELRGYSTEIDAEGWPVDVNHPANRVSP